MWILYAFASAFFAGVTAVLAKLGMEGVNSHLATALRTIVVALFGWAMVWVAGSSGAVGALEPRSWLFLILSGLATGGSWLCYFRALQLGEVNQVAPVDKSSTVLTMLLSILLLGEAAHWNTLLGMGLILAGTLGMLQRKPRERASSGWGWLPWAVLSAVCASLTSILGKVGMTGVGSGARAGAPAGDSDAEPEKLGVSGCVRRVYRAVLDVLLPGAPGGAGQRCGPHRQAEHSSDSWLFLPGAP